MARRLGVDLAAVKGSGGGVGRVVAGDVLAMSEHLRSPRDVEPAPADTQESLGEEVGKMRRAIARRTVQSKQTIPHFYVTMPIDMDRALDMLEQLNTATPDRKITVNDLVVKASAAALGRYPDVNVSYTPDERLVRHPSMNIGVAVGTDDGLRIPVVTDCGHRSLRDLSAEVRRLVGRTKSGALTPQEMSGGTFTVSNLGMLGVEEFAAIVNPPEAAILAVGAAAPEVTVDQNGAFVARRRMRVTLSCDHRVVDGVLGARFLQEVKRLLEAPCLLLE
jgi:pyruvate dehydrogenase E2 component (dihydrolipoamide acetyltransferase)